MYYNNITINTTMDSRWLIKFLPRFLFLSKKKKKRKKEEKNGKKPDRKEIRKFPQIAGSASKRLGTRRDKCLNKNTRYAAIRNETMGS